MWAERPSWQDDDVQALMWRADPSGVVEEARDAAAGVTRGDLLRRAVVVSAAVTVTASTAPALAAERNRRDTAILNFALSLEYLQAAFYTEAQQRDALTGKLARQARVVGGHERVHVKALLQQLGRDAIKRPRFDFHGTTEDAKAYRDTAVAFEDLSVAAYQGQAPNISSRGYLVAVVGIQSTEARHAAWIRRLAGVVPAAQAFDEPISKTRARTLVMATDFIAKPTRMTARSRPKFTG